MISLKKFLLALNNIYSFSLRRYSDQIKYGDILERQSISVRNHQIVVNSLIHIIQFELIFSAAPNILGETGTLTFPAKCVYTTLDPKYILSCDWVIFCHNKRV